MIPVLSLYFIAGFALAQVVITMLVGAARAPNQVHFDDGGDMALRRNIRAHGNFTETVPICLIAMTGAETAGAPAWVILAGGTLLVVGRAMHYWIMRRKGWGWPRAISMLMTLAAMGGFALAILWQMAGL